MGRTSPKPKAGSVPPVQHFRLRSVEIFNVPVTFSVARYACVGPSPPPATMTTGPTQVSSNKPKVAIKKRVQTSSPTSSSQRRTHDEDGQPAKRVKFAKCRSGPTLASATSEMMEATTAQPEEDASTPQQLMPAAKEAAEVEPSTTVSREASNLRCSTSQASASKANLATNVTSTERKHQKLKGDLKNMAAKQSLKRGSFGKPAPVARPPSPSLSWRQLSADLSQSQLDRLVDAPPISPRTMAAAKTLKLLQTA